MDEKKGGLTGVIGLSQDGKILGKELFSDDEKGNVVEATFVSEDESRPKKAKHSCDFDRQGALLDDAKGILVQQTKNVQSARQVRFTSLREIVKLEPVLKA